MNDISITRNELAWLITRLIGVLFLWIALTKIAAFGFAAYMLTTTGYDEIRSNLGSRISWDLAWPQAMSFIFYGMAAFYFLRHGAVLHRLLSRGGISQDNAENIESFQQQS